MTAPGTVSGVEKAAILLVLLGEEVASGLCSHLPQDQWRRLARTIAGMETVPSELAARVLAEYQGLSGAETRQHRGGPDFVQKVLSNAFGEEAERLLEHVVFAEEESAREFERLQRANPEQLAALLAKESLATVSLILSHLGPRAAAVLKHLPESVGARALERLARMRPTPPELVRKVASLLSRRLDPVDAAERRPHDGARSAAKILTRLDPAAAKAVLASIEETDAELAERISDCMFTFEDLIQVADAGIRELLAEADKKLLAVALLRASEALKAHIFRSMSSRAVQMIEEDMEVLGQVRTAEIINAQKQLVALARKLDGEGRLTLRPEQHEDPVN